jgi:DNA-binding MarR family transcriptional regulator
MNAPSLAHLSATLDVFLRVDGTLSLFHVRAFLLIAGRGDRGTTQADLARELGCSQASASRAFSRLGPQGSNSVSVGRALGWIELLPDLTDPRVKVAFVSDAGKELLRLLESH